MTETQNPTTTAAAAPVQRSVPEATLSAEQARALTDTIRADLGSLAANLAAAYRGRAWAALGYGTWAAYTAAEFAADRWALPRGADRDAVLATLAEAGMSQRDMAAATSLSQSTISRALNPPDADESRPFATATHGDVWFDADGWETICQRMLDVPEERRRLVSIPDTMDGNIACFVDLSMEECAAFAAVLAIHLHHGNEGLRESRWADAEDLLETLLEQGYRIEHWTVVGEWVRSLPISVERVVARWVGEASESWPLTERMERAQSVLAVLGSGGAS